MPLGPLAKTRKAIRARSKADPRMNIAAKSKPGRRAGAPSGSPGGKPGGGVGGGVGSVKGWSGLWPGGRSSARPTTTFYTVASGALFGPAGGSGALGGVGSSFVLKKASSSANDPSGDLPESASDESFGRGLGFGGFFGGGGGGG